MPKLFRWGERGMVSTLFEVLHGDSIKRWSEFLVPIGLSANADIEDIYSVIEPDFGQFGKPDAVVHVKLRGRDQPLIILMEAKRCTYEMASRSRVAYAAPGFNSSINGQVELNHRLILALIGYSHAQHVSICEPQESWQHYEPAAPRGPRYVLKQLVRDLAHDLDPFSLPHCYHLLITTDTLPAPWNQVCENRRPRCYRPNVGEDWPWFEQRLRWTSWATVSAMIDGWDKTVHFHKNYITKFAAGRVVAEGAVPPRGVWLYALPAVAYDQLPFPPTWLHVSSNNKNFVVRRYPDPNADRPTKVELNSEQRALFTNFLARHECRQGERPRLDDCPWWYNQILTRNVQQGWA